MYGRRRVGKTAIINEFTKGKSAVFFTGVETNEKQNLENFSKSILEFITKKPANTSFDSFQTALEFVFDLAKEERIVLVIDEYPYVARASKSLASTLQLLIDKYKDTSKLFLILCGSSMSYMEDQVLAYKAPLYGRRTAQFKVQPFEFQDACKYFNQFSGEDKALAYGIVGGTPQYLLQLNDKLSMEDNIKNTYFNPTSSIYEEPQNLLKQEVREPAIYNAIIAAIATGYTKMSEISTKVGEDSARKTIYSIEDNMFRFWYRFVPENTSIISRGATELAYSRIQPHLSDYMGGIFEEICKQYLWTLLLTGKCAIDFTDIGRWWGTNPKTRQQVEIDIMGTADKNTALFAECKWTNEKVDLSVPENLEEKSTTFGEINPLIVPCFYLHNMNDYYLWHTGARFHW